MTVDRVMLLIDADNVSVDVIEQGVAWVGKHFGGPHVRRAYCTAESAVKHQALFKRLSIRPMVNLAAGKNSTDIALAIDAIDLAIAERPEVMVIASSDSDFAPLVARLREKGCKVIGIGQQGKTGDETQTVYDDYEVLTHHKTRAPSPRAEKPAAKKAPARRAAAKKAAPPAPPPLPEKVLQILRAMPELARGEPQELNVVASRLRELGLLSKSASSTRLFQQFPEVFVLEPKDKPHKLRTLRPIAL
jgi:NYN domain